MLASGSRVRKVSTKKHGRLATYRDKRDPTATTEPFGAERNRSAGATRVGRFVVHLHDATRRHYDLRIEVGGTLKSFAVPKGPSLDPGEKRLAVQTEDHPLEYLDFEDVIPEGSYGAGPMIAWDMGRVRYLEGTAEEGIERGKIDFELGGFKLAGRFGLIATGRRAQRAPAEQSQWLLVKKSDASASTERDPLLEQPESVLSGLGIDQLGRRAEIARAIERSAAERGAPEGSVDARALRPMLCSANGAPLEDPGRIYELKLDGVRIVAERQGDNVILRYRHGRVATASYPDIARALRALAPERFVLDGEIVAFDERGRPRFQRLGSRIQALRPADLLQAVAETPVVYLVFDVLQVGSRSLGSLPLLERKAILAELVRGRGFVRALDHISGQGRALFELCEAEGVEGIVAKRASSPYRPGPRRSEDWVKLKCARDDEFVIVGWEQGKGARSKLGALRIASYVADSLILRGRVGSGLDDRSLRTLTERLAALEVDAPTAEGQLLPRAKGRPHHVRPELVASVRFLGWSDDGHLRDPVFVGLREDVDPRACTAMPTGESFESDRSEQPAEPAVATRVAVTNRHKLFWPDDGITKGDLCDYYAAVAPVMLPFLKDRPVVLVRHPDGIEGKSFYQWRVPAGTPSFIPTLELRDDEERERRGKKSVFLLNSLDALVHIANLGAIPIHVLASRASDPSCGDFFTIDLDLGQNPFRLAATLALTLREQLEAAGLLGYPKTSGQKGLHVLVPVGPGVPFTATKLLAELFGRLLEARHPEIATMERRVSQRGGKVYIDTGQTGRSRTIVAPYSVRAHPGATVSTPLRWEEVHAALDPKRFTIASVVARIAEQGDPMADLLEQRPDVKRALIQLEAQLGA
jgi:bifunctional non-homologous end joining protein LigD